MSAASVTPGPHTRDETHQHLTNEMSRCNADNETDDHAGKDGHDRLVHGANALDLEVVRCAQRADKQDTENAQTPPGRQSAAAGDAQSRRQRATYEA